MTVNQFTDLAAKLRDYETMENPHYRPVVRLNAADLLDACAPLLDLDWPCETCGGTRNHPHITDNPCDDCIDGQTSPAVRVRKLIEEHESLEQARRLLRRVGRDA